MIANSLYHAGEHREKKVLVAGHTDTVDHDDNSVVLSRCRADSAHGMLVGMERICQKCAVPIALSAIDWDAQIQRNQRCGPKWRRARQGC